MTIPAAFLDELRDRTSLSARIMRTVKLQKAGREFKGCCPFHTEKSPSFTVSDEKGFYHCFGCGAHGDIIRWCTDQEGLGFIDAVKELAAAAGMEVPAPDPRQAEREKASDRLITVNGSANLLFSAELRMSAAGARAYLAERGINQASIDKFGIGYASGHPPIAEALDGAPIELLVAAGLVRKNPDGPEIRDMFKRRLIIPIHDARGRIIGFGGRIIGTGEPKYINTPDTDVFNKGKSLFNLHRAAPAARATGRLLVVEGYMDVIGVDAVGFEQAVAPNGTALTEAQMFLLWKLVDAPILCFDGDRPGWQAAVRAAKRALPILAPGKTLKFVTPPDGKDPDDVAREGGLPALESMLEQPIALVDVLWRDLTGRHNVRDPDSLARLRSEARQMVGEIKDRDVKRAYGSAFKTLLDGERERPGQRRGAVSRQPLADAFEDAIFIGICKFPDIVAAMLEHIGVIRWIRPEHSQIVDLLIAEVDVGAILTPETLEQVLEQHGLLHFMRDTEKRLQLRVRWLEKTEPEPRKQLVDAIIAKRNPK